MRHADVVDIACFSPIVNTTGAIFVHPEGILKRTTYHVFDMYVNMLEEYMVPTNLRTERLVHGKASTGVMDCILTSDKEGTRYALAVVNKDPEKSHSLNIDFEEMGVKMPKKISGTVLCGSSPDDFNEIGAENRVVPEERIFEVKDGTVELPAHSLVVLKF
jgi:alpha-N-arabinofuranosidase